MRDDEARSLMTRALEDVLPAPDALESTRAKAQRRSRRRKALTILTASAISVASLAFVVSTIGSGSTPSSKSQSGGESTSPPIENYPEPLPGAAALPLSSLASNPQGDAFLVVFPDGTQAVVALGPQLDVSGLGLRGATQGRLTDSSGSCCDRTIELYYGTPEDTGLLSDSVLQIFRAADGAGVELREGDPKTGAELYLVYRFGPWTGLVYDTKDSATGMTDDERAAWAAGLSGHVEASGAITLIGSGDVELEKAGFPVGPKLLVVGTDHAPELSMNPSECTPSGEVQIDEIPAQEGGPSTWFANWCPADGGITVRASSGDEQTVRDLVEGVRITMYTPSEG